MSGDLTLGSCNVIFALLLLYAQSLTSQFEADPKLIYQVGLTPQKVRYTTPLLVLSPTADICMTCSSLNWWRRTLVSPLRPY